MARKAKAEMAKSGIAFPDLYTLHKKHRGFYEPLCIAYADAVGVCMSRHHEASPSTFVVSNGATAVQRNLEWKTPDSKVRANWNNDADARRNVPVWSNADSNGHLRARLGGRSQGKRQNQTE
jgi:hypothetical protein